MSAVNGSGVDAASVKALQDRFDVTDVLFTYSTAVDSFDYAGLRATLADDIWAQYGNGEAVTSGDALAAWIEGATTSIVWQHHLLSPYQVTIDGDHAKALSYLTSYQVFEENPDEAVILVARYHDELKRTPSGWKISRRTMEVLWGETKAKSDFLDQIGGRGPKVWARG